MGKGTKTMLTMAALMGVGTASWLMYKKKNPNALEDVKTTTRNMAHGMLEKLENME